MLIQSSELNIATFEPGIEAEKMKISISTQTDVMYASKQIGTDLSLADRRYDSILSDMKSVDNILGEYQFRQDLLLKADLIDKVNFNPLKPADCSQVVMNVMNKVLKPSISKLLKTNTSLDVMNPLLVYCKPNNRDGDRLSPGNQMLDVSGINSKANLKHNYKHHQNLPVLAILPAQDHYTTVNDLTVDLGGSATDVDKNASQCLTISEEANDGRLGQDRKSESPSKSMKDQDDDQGGFSEKVKQIEKQSNRSRRSSIAAPSIGSITQPYKMRINLLEGANSCVNNISRIPIQLNGSPKSSRPRRPSMTPRKSLVPSISPSKSKSRASIRQIATSPRENKKIKIKKEIEDRTPKRKVMLRKSMTVDIDRVKHKGSFDDEDELPVKGRHSISRPVIKPELPLDTIQETPHDDHEASPVKHRESRVVRGFQIDIGTDSDKSRQRKASAGGVSQSDIDVYGLQVSEVYKKLTADNFKVYDVLTMMLYIVSFEVNKYGIYDKLLKDMRADLESTGMELNLLKTEHSKCRLKIDDLTDQVNNSPKRGDLSETGKEETVQSLALNDSKSKNNDLKTKIQEFTDLLERREDNTVNQSHARQLISVLSTGRFTQFKNPMPLRAVLKSISTIYAEKHKDSLKSLDIRSKNFEEYVYEYYMQYFGIKDIADKKFCYFILSLKYHALYFRVNMFSRFMGLIPGFCYNQEQISKYVEGLNFLETNNKGFNIKNTDTSARVCFPYLRAEDYIKFVFDKKLSLEELFELKKKVEDCKEEDPTSRNTALIDADVFLEKIIEKYGSLINRTKQHVVDAFDSCDLDGNKTCSVNEWVLLYRYLEPDSFELSSCIKMFFENANKYIKGEHCMNFDKFAVVCTDKGLFSEEKQNMFINAANGASIENACEAVRLSWTIRYSELRSKLASIHNLTEDEVDKWQHNLDVLNHQFIDRSSLSIKSTTIAYYLTLNELDRMKQVEVVYDKNEDD